MCGCLFEPASIVHWGNLFFNRFAILRLCASTVSGFSREIACMNLYISNAAYTIAIGKSRLYTGGLVATTKNQFCYAYRGTSDGRNVMKEFFLEL